MSIVFCKFFFAGFCPGARVPLARKDYLQGAVQRKKGEKGGLIKMW